MFTRDLPDEFVERVVRSEEQLKSLAKELGEFKKLAKKLEKETADMRLICGVLKKIPGGIKGRIMALALGVTLISFVVDLSIKVTGFDAIVKQKILSTITEAQ
jgi:hypothetical protein